MRTYEHTFLTLSLMNGQKKKKHLYFFKQDQSSHSSEDKNEMSSTQTVHLFLQKLAFLQNLERMFVSERHINRSVARFYGWGGKIFILLYV